MRKDLGAWALAARLGWTVAIWIIASLLLGIWLDSVLHTSPFATLILVLLGSLAAIIGVYREASAAMNAAAGRRQPSDREKPHEPHEREED